MVTETATRECGRCGGYVVQAHEDVEPSCLMCGDANYKYKPPSLNLARDRMMGAASDIVRYRGKDRKMHSVTVQIYHSLTGRKGRMQTRIICPFCPAEDKVQMRNTSLSGIRRDYRQTRYVGEGNHRISLSPPEKGETRWN